MKIMTAKEAVERVNRGDNLEGVILEESTIKQVNVRDVMVLARGGILLPEQSIYYNDEDIEYDEDVDELEITSGVVKLTWEEKAIKARDYNRAGKAESETMINLSTQKPEIDDWIAMNRQKIESLLKPIVISLFNAEKAVKE
jgi:hypothetical protein